MKRIFALLSLLVLCATYSLAQEELDTVKLWNLGTFSGTTIDNMAADATHWTLNSKGGRYQNVIATDGSLLTANGKVIPELDGIYIGKGIGAGSLLLCFNRGTSGNGVQMQTGVPVTIKDMKKGDIVKVSIRSSSSSANGIKAITNMTGEVGSDTYTTTGFKVYSFTVAEDGDVSFTHTNGVIINMVGIFREKTTSGIVATPKAKIEGNLVTLSCPTEDAKIYYSIVDHGTVWDYAKEYTEPISLTHSVRLRVVGSKEGMHSSEVLDQKIDIPLVMPFEDKPYILDPEPLTRGAIATKATNGMLVNWRWLITDKSDATFNVYRNGTKLNGTPISNKTNYLDTSGNAYCKYTIEKIEDGQVTETSDAKILAKGYLDIPLERPANGTTESGEYMYVPGDCMVADLDGDNEYEIVMKWDPCNTTWDSSNITTLVNDVVNTAGQKDNSISGYTGKVLIDAYKMDGTKLWRIDLGKNIRAGAHYTQLMVYDLDGDGKAEVACKTAPGTIDGQGKNVLMGSDDPTADYRGVVSGKSGMVVKGPEYLTVFNGQTGAELATCKYNPPRDTVNFSDSYGNRSDRYLACVAYLDGKKPSLVMCRGYYTQAFLWAVDYREGKLSTRWLHSSTNAGYGAYGEGAHGLSVADVDGDGRDEIIYGSCAIDDNGDLLYRTGLGHGDALHVGDLMPDRNGLEVMMVHEETTATYGIEMHDALTGEHLSGVYAGSDVGRGMCADVDPTARGCEYWGFDNNVYDCEGNLISTKKPSVNFRTYWDGDLQDELTERGEITKWKSRTASATTLVNMITKYGAGVDLIKYTPCLQADIFGDWREEQIYYDNATFSHLWIFSTPYVSQYRVPCLMQDHQYRMATVWQTCAYNQPPHLSYYLPDYITNITGIVDVKTSSDEDNAVIYNMLGQRILSPSHGVNIINGRKYVLK